MSDEQELNILMGVYIESGKYTDEELAQIRKRKKQQLSGEDGEELKTYIRGDAPAGTETTSLSDAASKFSNQLSQNFGFQYDKVFKSSQVVVGDFLNSLDPSGGRVMDFIASGGDVNELVDDGPVGDVGQAWINEKHVEIDKIREKSASTDTGLGIVGGFKEGSILDMALGVSNALISGVSTMGPMILTKGRSIPVQIMTPMYTDFNAEKAKTLYPDEEFGDAITKLRETNQDEVVVPVTLGLLSTLSERIGVKKVTSGIQGVINNKGKNSFARNFSNFVQAGKYEAVTEIIQHGLETVNTSQARGDSWDVSSKKFVDAVFSEQGLESGLQGFIAGGGMTVGGKKIQSAFRTTNDNVEINRRLQGLANLNEKKRKAYDPKVRQYIDQQILEQENQLQDILVSNRKKSNYLTREESSEMVDILNEKKDLQGDVIQLDKQFKKGVVTEQQYKESLQEINNQRKLKDQRVNEIKSEANKKLLHDGLRTEFDAISQTSGLEMEVKSTQEEFHKAVNAHARSMGKAEIKIEDLRDVDGLNFGGKIIINEAVAAETNAVSVGSHELLHSVVKSSLNGAGRIVKDSNGNDVKVNLTVEGEQMINDFLDTLTSREKRIVQERIDNNYRFNKDGTEKNFAEYAEEYLTAYSDASIKGELTPGVIKKLKTFFEKIFSKGDNGFDSLSFKTGEDVKNFLDAYTSDRKKGKYRQQFVDMANKGMKMDDDGIIRKSVTKKDKTPKERKKAINDIGKTYYDKDLDETISFEQLGGNAYWEMYSGKAKGFKDKITAEIQEQGLLDGVILEKYKNYKVNLDKIEVTKKMFLDGVYAELLPHIRNYKPEKQLEYSEKDRTGLNGWIVPQIGHKSSQAYEVFTEGQIQAPTVEVGQTTKEGDIKIQVEADVDQTMIDLETMDMSPQAVAKREAQKNKKKEVRKSKLRQDLGIEDNSDLYNKVKDSARQSLILAYQKTRGIENKNDRAAAIAKMIADEYAGEKGITSGKYTELFKLVKDSLGNKADYVKNLKKNRESIVESIFTSDFVQIERKVPENEKVFIVFKEKLTSKKQVEDAVDKGLLPKDSLKTIDEGQSVNLYSKVMPTPDQFVGFFNQPLTIEKTDKTGKTYYVRSGLKGTRKDGLAKHLSKALIFDALMEVRQEPDVSELLTNEFNAELDVVDLASKISREVDMKFSKSNAATDINNAIDSGTNTDVYNEIRFSKSHRDQYERRLEKNRPDLTEEQRKNAVQSIFDFVDGKDIPSNKKAKLEKLAMHYTANGYLILPEDGYKVIDAERVATIKKLDAFSYKNPNTLLEENVVKEKVKRTDPDAVGTFSNKTEYSDGVVVYDVEDSKQGQRDVRKVIDTHFGKNANPWCLCARQKEEILNIPDTEYFDNREEAEAMKMVFEETGRYESVKVIPFDWNQPDGSVIPQFVLEAKLPKKKPNPNYDELKTAWTHWKSYNQNTEGLGFKIAFHNGELVAFRDGKESPRWWDRMDKPSDAPMIKSKKGKDGYKTVSLAYKNKTTPQYLEKVTGNNKTGVEIRKDLDGTVTDIKSKKDGKNHGKQFHKRNDRSEYYIQESTEEYNQGKFITLKQKRIYKNYKGESGTESFTNGRDEIRVDNITKYERFYSGTGGKTITTIEGTVNQNLTASNERYYSRQGEKITLTETRSRMISTKKDHVVTINGEVQETRTSNTDAQFSKNKLKALSILQAKKKPLPALLGKIQEIEKRIQEGTATESDYYLKANGVLERMQELFEEGNYSAIEIYNIVIGKLPSIPDSLNVDFSSSDNFVQFIKNTLMPKIRSIGFEASKKYLSSKLQEVDERSEKIRLINEFIINIGRSTRDNYREQGITTNRQFYDEVLMPLESIVGKNFIKNNYDLEKIDTGERMVFRDKEGGVYSIVPLYKDPLDIKINARSNQQVVKEVNEEARVATDYVMSIVNDTSLTKAEKLAIIDLMSLSQRGAIRKMYKMGETLTPLSTLDSKDLILEHQYPVKEIVDRLQERVKNNISKTKLKNIIEKLRVHVFPSDVDVLLNEAGKRSSGGFERYSVLSNYLHSLHLQGQITTPTFQASKSNRPDLNSSFEEVIYRASKSNKPTKGITILDFDDTLATTKSMIRFTRPDGSTGSLNAEQYASTYEELTELGYKWDFSEFNKVVDGKPAPLLNKAKKLAGKFGTDNMFILTARPAESAVAIQKFLKENGLDIPLKNITGLGNSTADAKALWVLDKAAEGYNDFYFADDAIQNVKAVQNMLDQIDVKSKVQQAKIKFSKSRINEYFNNILKDKTNIDPNKKFSQAEAQKEGEFKGKYRYFIPPSHEDFMGLLYNFMTKGRKGDNARKFFETTLIKPLNRAYRKLNEHRQVISNNYKKLLNHMPEVQAILSQKAPDSNFTFEDAVRVYLWNKAGYKIPGITKQQENALVNLVKQYSDLQRFADHLGRISLVKEGYTTPGDSWTVGNIKYDLVDATGRVGRAKFFAEFQENADIIFSQENLNKIEAIYGRDFRDAVEDSLYRTKTGNNRPAGGSKLVNGWIDWINGSVGATMFFNMRSAILQQMSMVNFMNFGDNNVFKAAAAFGNQEQYWADFSMIFNSNYLKQRRSGAAFDVNANEIAREVSGARHPVRKAIRFILDKGFLPTQMGDSFAIATGGAGFYRNRVNTYLKQGLSKKKAEEKAFLDFQEIAEETQQSARPDMISSQQSGPLGRFILAFQNVTSQYARIVKKSFLDLTNRRISKGYTSQEQSDTANISRIIYYGAVQSVIFYGLQTALFAMLFSDEEEEEFFGKKKDRVINGTIDSLLRGTGVYGAVFATIKNYSFKLHANLGPDSEKYFKTSAWEQLMEISPPIGIKIRKWRSMERTLDWNEDVIKNMSIFDIDNPIHDAVTTGIEGFTNVPLNRLYRKIQNIRAGFDSENAWFQRIAVTLGWSKWDVGIDDKIDKSEYKNVKSEKDNKKLQRKEREQGLEVGCAAVSRKGTRCGNTVLSGGDYCTIHVKVEKNESGEKARCKKIKSSGGRCKMQTASKSGYCYYHD